MQNLVDDISLRLTAAGSTRTDTVVLLRLDSGALECKARTFNFYLLFLPCFELLNGYWQGLA